MTLFEERRVTLLPISPEYGWFYLIAALFIAIVMMVAAYEDWRSDGFKRK